MNHWMKLGNTGEQAFISYIKEQNEVKDCVKHNHKRDGRTKVKDIVAFEHKYGDLVLSLNDGTEHFVEIKTDTVAKYTGNIGFEMFAKWNEDPLSHAREVGWWNPHRKSEYYYLCFVMMGGKSVMINNVNECKQWCLGRKDLFKAITTNPRTQAKEKKVSLSWYANVEEFVRECPYASFIDIDTSEIEKVIQSNDILRARDKRFKDRYS